jgi:inorganic triphosphatase YgiF
MRELELKFWLPLSLQDSLARESGEARVERVWSCYLDTPDGALARARVAVRVRRQGEAWLQTVKADHGDHFERFEWERPIAGPEPQRDALPPEDTPQGALAHRTFGQWRPLFETDFERRARVVEPTPGLAVEIAQDVGEIRCGERREPIREVELECLRGSRAAFFEWALDWATRARASLLLPTKNERGLRLAARLPLAPSPVKAGAVAPPPEAPVGEAAASVLRACVAHACANVEPILSSDAPEGPHQLRVALRRLRAALRFFELREADPRWQEVDAQASAIADAAGRVRDLDVFEEGGLQQLRERFAGDAAIETLSRAVLEARDAARMDLRRVVAGPATTRFVLGALALAEALAAPVAQASSPPSDTAGATPEPSVTASPDPNDVHRGVAPPPGAAIDRGMRYGEFAGARLHALLARVRRRANRARDDEGWHRTRLAVKTLRYAIEFARGALPGGADPERAAVLLARWQETLGAGQDLAAARDVAADALSRPGVATEAAVRALALIDGWRAFSGPAVQPARHARRTVRALREALRDAAAARRGDPPEAPAGRMR